MDNSINKMISAMAKEHAKRIDNYFKECLGEKNCKILLKLPRFITKRLIGLEIIDSRCEFSNTKMYTLILFPNIKLLRHRFRSIYI